MLPDLNSPENNQPDPYEAVIASFKQLQKIKDAGRLEFELVQAARSLKLPISSFRKMFRHWLAQQGGQDNA